MANNNTYSPIELPPGISRAGTARSTSGRWYDCNLIRWKNGTLAPIGGWQQIPCGTLPSTARVMHGWEAQNGARMIAIGCDQHMMLLWEQQLSDITPDAFKGDETTLDFGGYGVGPYSDDLYSTPRAGGEPADFLVADTISLANFGDLLMGMTERDGRLLVFDPRVGPQQTFKPVVPRVDSDGNQGPAIPQGNRGMCVTPERSVVIIGANGDDRLVAWSDREDYQGWDFENVATEAGFQQVNATSGLIACKVVKDGTLIFSNTEVFLMRFIGQPYIYGFDLIDANSSLICPYAIAAFDGKAMWMTRTGFKMYNGGAVSDVPCDFLDFILTDINPTWGRLYTHAVVNNVYEEVTWYYSSNAPGMRANDDYFHVDMNTLAVTHLPDQGGGETVSEGSPTAPDSYITFYYGTDQQSWWSKGKLDRSAGVPVNIDYNPVMADSSGNLWLHEVDGVTAFSSPGAGPIFAKSGAIAVTPGGITTVNGVLPDSESGYNSTQWTFTTRMTPEAADIVYGPYLCRPDGYMDTRFTARQVEIEVQQIKDGAWTLGKPEFDAKARGRR